MSYRHPPAGPLTLSLLAALALASAAGAATAVRDVVTEAAHESAEIAAAIETFEAYIERLRAGDADGARALWHPRDDLPVYDWGLGRVTWRGRDIGIYTEEIVGARELDAHVELIVQWTVPGRESTPIRETWSYVREGDRMVGVSALALHTSDWEVRRAGDLVVHWPGQRLDWAGVQRAAEEIAAAHEALGLPGGDVHVYACRNRDEVGRIFGRPSADGLAHLRNGVVATINEFSSHEAMHVITHRLEPDDVMGRALGPVAEGIAYALGGGTWLSRRCLMSWAAERFRAGEGGELGELLLDVSGFDRSDAAAELGAFVRCLIERGEPERFARFYREAGDVPTVGTAIRSAFGEWWTHLEPACREQIARAHAPAIRAGPLGEDRRVVVEVTDPGGDDTGDGDYLYPTARDLEPGAFDLAGARLTRGAGRIGVEIDLAALAEDESPWGFTGTFCRVVVRRGGDEYTTQDLGPELRAGVRADDAIDLVVDVSPQGVLVRNGRGQWLDILTRPRENERLAEGRTLAFSVPVELVGSAPESWRFQVLTAHHAPAEGLAGGVGHPADVPAERILGSGTGGDPGGYSPNVYDLLDPADADQAEILGAYSAEGGWYVFVPLRP